MRKFALSVKMGIRYQNQQLQKDEPRNIQKHNQLKDRKLLQNQQFKATLMLENLINEFKKDIPLKQKYRFFKCYNLCFTEKEATSCLLVHMRSYCQSSKDINTAQASKLFRTLVQTGVVKCVWSGLNIDGKKRRYSRMNLYTLTNENENITEKLFHNFLVRSPSNDV